MGCWSESCAISGLEIGAYQDAVVMIVEAPTSKSYDNYGTFSRFVPVCPPTFGQYSDYGDLEDDNDKDLPFFLNSLEAARRKFDPDTKSHMDYMNQMWWVRKDVWDFCDSLPLEFSYGDRPKTVGECVTRQREKILEYVKEVRETVAESDEDVKLRRLFRSMSSSSRDLFQLGYLSNDLTMNYKHQLDEAIENNNDEVVNNIIEAVGRLLKVSIMCYELRRVVCPSTKIGPQHGGHDAISMLATFTLTKCQEYFADVGEED